MSNENKFPLKNKRKILGSRVATRDVAKKDGRRKARAIDVNLNADINTSLRTKE
jgi:hypothetical protein